MEKWRCPTLVLLKFLLQWLFLFYFVPLSLNFLSVSHDGLTSARGAGVTDACCCCCCCAPCGRYLSSPRPRVLSCWVSRGQDRCSWPRPREECPSGVQHHSWGRRHHVWHCHQWTQPGRHSDPEKGMRLNNPAFTFSDTSHYLAISGNRVHFHLNNTMWYCLWDVDSHELNDLKHLLWWISGRRIWHAIQHCFSSNHPLILGQQMLIDIASRLRWHSSLIYHFAYAHTVMCMYR